MCSAGRSRIRKSVKYCQRGQKNRKYSQVSAAFDIILDAPIDRYWGPDHLTAKQVEIGVMGRVSVKVGQKIGDTKAFIGAPIHSSVSGKVIAVERRPHFTGFDANAVVIEPDGKQEQVEFKEHKDIHKLTPEKIEKELAGSKEVIKEFKITAKDGKFEPNVIKVNKGETILIKLTSVGEPAGFKSVNFSVDEYIPADKETEIKFIASIAGEYNFFSNVPSSHGNQNLKGQIIVEGENEEDDAL